MAMQPILDERRAAQLRADYKAGATYARLAAKYGVSPGSVARYVAGLTNRTRPLTDEQESRAVAAYREGATLREVAAAFGVTVDAVLGALKRAGVPRRPARPRSAAAEDPYPNSRPTPADGLGPGAWVPHRGILIWEPGARSAA